MASNMGLCVAVLVVDLAIDSAQSPKVGIAELPHDLSFSALAPLADTLTDYQNVQIVVGIREMRQAFSARLVTHMRLVRFGPDWLSRADVTSADNRERLLRGEVVIALEKPVDFQGRGAAGRPEAGPIDETLKGALGQSVARMNCLVAAAGDRDAATFHAGRDELGHQLQAHDALFNLNDGHKRHGKFPVLNWCETNGPMLLAQSYGLAQPELEAALGAACAQRLRFEPFAAVMAREMSYLDTLLVWISAYRGRKDGEASRRDSLQRFVKRLQERIGPPPRVVAAPHMRKPVRESLSAERLNPRLSDRAMLETAIMFDLQPAYDVLLTRLYLEPVLCVAGLIGELGLRKKVALIQSPIAAGGLIAMVEERGFANDDFSGVDGEGAPEDEIPALQARLEIILAGLGVSMTDLAERGRAFLLSGEPVSLPPSPGPPRFFLEDRH